MNNIEDLLRTLTEEDDENEENTNSDYTDNTASQSSTDGLFSGLDPEMMLKILSLFESFNKSDENERFLLALKPLLREENQSKIDSAVRLMKLLSLLPVLQKSGLLDNFNKLF